jgi:hypothetical protein
MDAAMARTRPDLSGLRIGRDVTARKEFMTAVERKLDLGSYAMGDGPTPEQVTIAVLRELAGRVEKHEVMITSRDLFRLANEVERYAGS